MNGFRVWMAGNMGIPSLSRTKYTILSTSRYLLQKAVFTTLFNIFSRNSLTIIFYLHQTASKSIKVPFDQQIFHIDGVCTRASLMKAVELPNFHDRISSDHYFPPQTSVLGSKRWGKELESTNLCLLVLLSTWLSDCLTVVGGENHVIWGKNQ